MTRRRRKLCGAGLAMLLLAALPSHAAAGWFGLRNDTGGVLVVRRATVVNDVAGPGQPLVLYPGETAWDGVVQPCAKVIAVYAPHQPGQPLLQSQVRCGGQDLFYAVQVSAGGQVRLVPTRPAVATTRRTGR